MSEDFLYVTWHKEFNVPEQTQRKDDSHSQSRTRENKRARTLTSRSITHLINHSQDEVGKNRPKTQTTMSTKRKGK
jgi:hypothetical protein